MRIEILCTGDEVLTGKIVNSNFSYVSQKLEDVGLAVIWGTTVGDDRAMLLDAFRLASARADIVIVNGGLGPTVDDLSQEIAAEAAGVGLVLNEEWLATMEGFFTRRDRTMPPNNKKQAMLPEGSEVLDNPIGTACGFALDIGRARFFFTPGVPRELRRMLEEQIIPRLLARAGTPGMIYLKRFHSYGLGESHVDQLLDGVEALVADGSVKLGFRAHYPQLETKLVVRGADRAEVDLKLAPVMAEVRRRMGNFIMAEDDETLEGVVLRELGRAGKTLAVVETYTSGGIVARMAHLPAASGVFRRGVVSGDEARAASDVAIEAAAQADASTAFAVIVAVDAGPDRMDLGGSIDIAIADGGVVVTRQARILGGREWIRLGAIEMAMDCLRRHLQGLPIDERSDFERR